MESIVWVVVMLRDYSPGQRVTSIAVQSLGIGTVLVPSTTHVIVEWDDGSWSKERYQDLIYVGESADEPLPIPTLGGNPIPRRGSNDKTKDSSTKLDLDPQHKFDDSVFGSKQNRPPAYMYSVSSLNPTIFEADWSLADIDTVGVRNPIPNSIALKQQMIEDELQAATTRWLLHNQGRKLHRRF